MYFPLVGLGAEWAAWVTTALVWALLAALTIAALSWTDKTTTKK